MLSPNSESNQPKPVDDVSVALEVKPSCEQEEATSWGIPGAGLAGAMLTGVGYLASSITQGLSDYMRDDRQILSCAYKGDIEGLKGYLASGVDINFCNEEGRTPLITATLQGHAKLVEFLLENGADANQSLVNGETALHVVCSRHQLNGNDLACAFALLSKVQDFPINNHGHSAMAQAAHNGHVQILEKVNPDLLREHCDKTREHLLILAARKNYPEIVEYLVGIGVALNRKYKFKTALDWATLKGNHDIAKFLRQQNAKQQKESKDDVEDELTLADAQDLEARLSTLEQLLVQVSDGTQRGLHQLNDRLNKVEHQLHNISNAFSNMHMHPNTTHVSSMQQQSNLQAKINK